MTFLGGGRALRQKASQKQVRSQMPVFEVIWDTFPFIPSSLSASWLLWGEQSPPSQDTAVALYTAQGQALLISSVLSQCGKLTMILLPWYFWMFGNPFLCYQVKIKSFCCWNACQARTCSQHVIQFAMACFCFWTSQPESTIVSSFSIKPFPWYFCSDLFQRSLRLLTRWLWLKSKNSRLNFWVL